MIKTETIKYGDAANNFVGKICFDADFQEPRPGILVVHTIRGCTDFEIEKAAELAKSGYVGFAVDMYGNGRNSENSEEARPWMNELNENRNLLRERILLAFETLKKHPKVDKAKTGAIGFCFGGKCVLDLVRSGTEINGVVSFHGVYDKPPFKENSPINSAVLVLHGWDDPLNTPTQTVKLAEELTERKADWQILSFGNTGHAFTNPKADSPEQGLFFNKTADKRAWIAMKYFFEEIFQEKAQLNKLRFFLKYSFAE